MKSKIKAFLLSVCVITLVLAATVGALAYFTDAEQVENTFTVGHVSITLDETKVNTDGVPVTPAARTEEGNEYHLLPGCTYVKDPTVRVEDGSSASYIRMMVEVENYTELKAAFPANKEFGKNKAKVYKDWYADGNLLIQYLVEGWDSTVWVPTGITVDAVNDTATYEFRYHEIVDEPGALEPLFTKIVVPGYINNEELANLQTVEINVFAHAIQSSGFANAEAAWVAFDTQNP